MKKHEKQAKEWFCRLVRLKGCLNTTGSPEYGVCFTCGRTFSFEQLQCGHFISGRTNALFFEETNSHLQCSTCNSFKGGNLEVYRDRMIGKYGLEEVERLESLRHTVKRITESKFSLAFSSYKKEYLSLLNE